MKKLFFIFIFLISGFVFCHSQGSKFDSLMGVLTTIKTDDTNKVNTLNAIAKELRSNQPDKALIFVNQAQALAEQLDFKRGMALAYNTLSIVYRTV